MMSKYRISGVPITENKRLVGILTNRDLRFENRLQPPDRRSDDQGKPDHRARGYHAWRRPRPSWPRHRIEKLPIVDEHYNLCGLITIKDIEKATKYPNSAARCERPSAVRRGRGRYRDTMAERIAALVEAKVDVISIDTAHGHSMGVLHQHARKSAKQLPRHSALCRQCGHRRCNARSDRRGR